MQLINEFLIDYLLRKLDMTGGKRSLYPRGRVKIR